MLQRLVEFSIRFRGVVLALAVALLGYGVFKAEHAKLDVFPDFVQPQATIQTEAPGLSPEQVESLVTRVIESSLSGISNVESMRSQSIPTFQSPPMRDLAPKGSRGFARVTGSSSSRSARPPRIPSAERNSKRRPTSSTPTRGGATRKSCRG